MNDIRPIVQAGGLPETANFSVRADILRRYEHRYKGGAGLILGVPFLFAHRAYDKFFRFSHRSILAQ